MEEPNDKEQEYIQLVTLLRVTHDRQSCDKDSKDRLRADQTKGRLAKVGKKQIQMQGLRN